MNEITEEILENQAYTATSELIETAKLKEGDLLVVGCSTSEILGTKIGSNSKPELAEKVFHGIYRAVKEKKIFLAAQCCEHLNRALILERTAADIRNYEAVNVVPQPKAGGSFATMAYRFMDNPVAVEHIKADAGMDIGDTLIGMHLKDVAVPVRLSISSIGNAHLVCARVRPKFIGGERAVYDKTLA
ncbi:MAG: TIGR01440 family protein [Clostridia bacterium]|nr:TIGR01440 family protein [Clostridia bacterium]